MCGSGFAPDMDGKTSVHPALYEESSASTYSATAPILIIPLAHLQPAVDKL